MHLRGGILRTCNDRTDASKTRVRRPTIGWWLRLSELKITNITYVPSWNTLETLCIKNGLKCSKKKVPYFNQVVVNSSFSSQNCFFNISRSYFPSRPHRRPLRKMPAYCTHVRTRLIHYRKQWWAVFSSLYSPKTVGYLEGGDRVGVRSLYDRCFSVIMLCLMFLISAAVFPLLQSSGSHWVTRPASDDNGMFVHRLSHGYAVWCEGIRWHKVDTRGSRARAAI